MEKKAVKRAYKKLMHDVQTKDFYTKIDLTNSVNCYVCEDCDHITKTKDVDRGVTPFLHSCENCNGFARSTMYNDIAPGKEPTQEWFRPILKDLLTKHMDNLDHILRGGLISRKVGE